MKTQQAFNEALTHLASEDPLDYNKLYNLSSPSKIDLVGFETVWAELKPKRRQGAMAILVETAEQHFEVNYDPLFILALKDEDPEVQVYAIDGLWESEAAGLIVPLLYLLKHGVNETVRAKAASRLGGFIYLAELEELDETMVQPIEQALLHSLRAEDESLEVRRRALESLAFSSRITVDDLILWAYHHDNEAMQVSAVFSMGRTYNVTKWGKKVLAELENPNEAIRFEAARACGELDLKKAIRPLIRLLKAEVNPEIKQNAIWSLGQIGGSAAQSTLEKLLDDDDAVIQTAAQEALDELILFSSGPGDLDMFDFMLDETTAGDHHHHHDDDFDTLELEDEADESFYSPDDYQSFNLN